MAKQGAPELVGIHVNVPGAIPPEIAKALQCGDPAPAGGTGSANCHSYFDPHWRLAQATAQA